MDYFLIGILTCGVIGIFAAFFGLLFWILAATLHLQKDLKNASGDLPTKVLPLSRGSEMTVSSLKEYTLLLKYIQHDCEAGRTKYSSLQFGYLSNQFMQFVSTNYLIRKHKVAYCTLAIFFLLLGFIPIIIFGLIFYVQFQSATKVERIFNEYFSGKLTAETQPASTANTTDQIAKLFELMKSGALSSVEFEDAKKKILQKVG